MDAVTDIALLALLGVTGVALLRLRNLFAVVMLSGIYSLLCAALYTMLDAVDVAFTEAAVGAGISTVLLLGTLALVGHEEKAPTHRPLLPLVVVLITGAALIYGTLDIPPFGQPDNPAHHHVAPRYIEESGEEIGVPNIVTSVLASYRGYDTMGETTVIFTAAVAVLLLIATGPRVTRQAGRPGPESPAPAGEGAPSGAEPAQGSAGGRKSGKRGRGRSRG
jgi:multicomponent Na+:H+ antiporter subunit B